jgi:hypothetical protein
MSQELAQDEHDADAEDYEIDDLENGGHRPLRQNDDGDDFGDDADDDDQDDRKRFNRGQGGPGGQVRDENVVFAMGEDSDEESESNDGAGERAKERSKYRDMGEDGDGDGVDHRDESGNRGVKGKGGYRDSDEEEREGDGAKRY